MHQSAAGNLHPPRLGHRSPLHVSREGRGRTSPVEQPHLLPDLGRDGLEIGARAHMVAPARPPSGHRAAQLGTDERRERARIDTTGNSVVLIGVTQGAIVPADMGTFRVDVEIENPARPGERRALRSVPVDTGVELSWLPGELLESLGVARNKQWRFRQAAGTVLERWTGIVVVNLAGNRTGDDVVSGEPGDLVLLGSRTLAGLNLRVEPVTKRLADAGPAPAAVAV
jgi:predicted aspartyl protease